MAGSLQRRLPSKSVRELQWAAGKVLDVAQAAARSAAFNAAAQAAACARNAVPVLGAAIGAAGAANTVWKASQDDATAEDKEEAMSYKEHRFRP